MKKMGLLFATVVMMLMLAFSVSAASEGDLSFELNDDGKSYRVDSCSTLAKGDLIIPNTHNGRAVTRIVEDAFYGCTGLTSITIPNSITYIEYCAIRYCTELTSLTLPFVGASQNDAENNHFGYIFGAKDYLENELYVPDSLKEVIITTPCKEIGEHAFYNCRGITSITMPESTVSIGAAAFYGCSSLGSITIPNSIINIESNTFKGTKYYNDASKWVEGILYIGNHLVKAKDTVNSCNVRQGTKTIADYAFYGCEDLASVRIPDSVNIIGDYAFFGCSSLESAIIGNNVTTVSNFAFFLCTNLISITMPDSVTSIGTYAFYDTGYFNDASNWSDRVLYIGNHLIGALKSITSCNIREGTKTIATGAFYECTNLYSVTIPESVVYIGGSAFVDTGLKTVRYTGSQKQWENILVDKNNEKLMYAKIDYFYGCKHKNVVAIKAVEPTCIKTGLTEGKKCSVCSTVIVAQKTISATGAHTGGTATCTKKAVCIVCKQSYGSLKSHNYSAATCKAPKTCKVCKVTSGSAKGHSYQTTITKATFKNNGKVVTRCSACGAEKTVTIYYPKSINLSVTTYTYNGKTKTPTVTVKDSKGKTISKDNYTVTYPKKRKSIGKYTVTVTFKGNYSGTKKLTFEIVPSKVTLSKLTAGKKQLTATWKTVSGATGYELQYSTSKKFTKKTTKTVTIKKAKTKKTTIKKLSKGKKYFVRVRAYKTVSGKKIYGGYSTVKNVKVK